MSRRNFLLGSLGLSALGASKANAQTPFTTFAFAATGEPAARTMPDRLAEIKNVKDFGAVGDDSTDDTAAIQAAVNWTSAANRGTIYFPLGSYKTTAPITFNAANINICFRGEGNGAFIDAKTFSGGGYVLDRHLGSPSNTGQVVIERLGFNGDGTATGTIRVGSCNSVMVRDCALGSLTTEDSAGNSSQNVIIENCSFNAGGLVMGGGGAVLECGFKNCVVAARMYGNGFFMAGNRLENCDTAYLLGLDSAGTDQNASGFAIIGGTTEGNWTNVDINGTCTGFYIGSLQFIGHTSGSTNAGVNGGLTISSYTYNSGNGLVTLTMAATIPEVLVPGIPITTAGLNIAGLNGTFNSVSASGMTVTYTGPTGQVGSPSPGGTLTLGTQYGLRVRANKASNGVFSGISAVGDNFDVAAAAFGTSTSRANNLVINSSLSKGSSTTGVDVSPPTNAYTVQFQQSTYDPIWTYSQLPQSTNVLEGDQFSISDSTTNTWGANVTVGSGGDHVLVRYNGTNYTVVAK